ncbi:MAG TPA: Gfo/Idh/MocA family oxidoreductase [Phototrophicaceae bacterium]|nr:Gfo/Idh/MocA family oxidoreductase [Phototrophicaceae bacterium]
MSAINVGLIGCGSFVRHTHLANILADERFRLYAAVDLNLEAAQKIAEESGAAYATDDVTRAMSDPNIEMIFICTPHHNHADLSIQAAQHGKHIYCEKPMGLSEDECRRVSEAVEQSGVKYIGGYNRAVAPFTLQARDLLAPLDAPMLIYHRMADWNPYNVGWLIDEKLSGSRIVGEGGHLVDMTCRLTGQNPVRVYAEGGNFAEPSVTHAADSGLINLAFPDGSAGVIMLSSIGSNNFPKEEIQITCANHTIAIYGFERMVVCGPSGQEEFTLPAQDKGLKAMFDLAWRVVREGEPSPIGLREAWRATRATLAAARSIRTHQVIDVQPIEVA